MTDLIAFYGSLRRDSADPHAPSRAGLAEFAGVCTLPGRVIKRHGYPALIPNDAGTVEGDLFRLVSERALAVFDDWEDYNPARPDAGPYRREVLRLVAPDALAWVYVLNDRRPG